MCLFVVWLRSGTRYTRAVNMSAALQQQDYYNTITRKSVYKCISLFKKVFEKLNEFGFLI